MADSKPPMTLLFYCTLWGQEQVPFDQFLQRVKAEGYDGVELSLPLDEREKAFMLDRVAFHQLLLVGQHWDTVASDYASHLAEFEQRLRSLAAAKPLYITSQTGKDFYTFEQNKTLLLLADRIAAETGVRIIHETHRGRFSFAAHVTRCFLEHLPELFINPDVSHWFAVAESFLPDQEEALNLAERRTAHIHARIGHTQGPQVSDPRAPEWQDAVQQHLEIWDRVIAQQAAAGTPSFGITCEFGPAPYMPLLPYTKQPVSDQWEVNAYMKDMLRKRYNQYTKQAHYAGTNV